VPFSSGIAPTLALTFEGEALRPVAHARRRGRRHLRREPRSRRDTAPSSAALGGYCDRRVPVRPADQRGTRGHVECGRQFAHEQVWRRATIRAPPLIDLEDLLIRFRSGVNRRPHRRRRSSSRIAAAGRDRPAWPISTTRGKLDDLDNGVLSREFFAVQFGARTRSSRPISFARCHVGWASSFRCRTASRCSNVRGRGRWRIL
jgi:hypothetical protein